MSKLHSVAAHRFGRDYTNTDKQRRMVGGCIVFAPRASFHQKKMLLPSDARDITGGSVASVPINQVPQHSKPQKENKSASRESVLSALSDLFSKSKTPKRKRLYHDDSKSDDSD